MINAIDVEATRAPLVQYSNDAEAPDDQLSTVYMNDSFWLQNKIEHITAPTSWRIIKRSNENTLEEVVFSIHGVLIAKDLPPVTDSPRVAKTRLKFLRQSVGLAGLGTLLFQDALLAIEDIHQHFDRTFAEGLLEALARVDVDGPDCSSIDLSNRYFTPISEAQGLEPKDFIAGVDPLGILQDIVHTSPTCQYVHTDDNQVHYFVLEKNASGQKIYTPCEPQIFRIGDIVKAQLSFVVIPMRGGKRKMLAILRSLTLVDSRFGAVNISKPEKPHATKLASIKRRIGYTTSLSSETSEVSAQKQPRMEVDS